MNQERILLTGGSGFLGRGIMAYAEKYGLNAEFIVYSRDELKQDQCRRKFPEARYILGDVRDSDRLYVTMQGVETVIHCGAIKYVDTAEFNVNECVDVNIAGSRCVIKAAVWAQVKNCIAISTDKAVEPANTYGLTKALMERLWIEAARNYPYIRFNVARYGNVCGSTGSVVPKFQKQAKEQGFVTITDPNMTRFWLTISDAVELILRTLSYDSGTILIPKAPAMKLVDLVKAIAPDSEVRITGIRPGEKIHEKLITRSESAKSDVLHDMFVYKPDSKPNTNICEYTSDNPHRWMTQQEFADAAAEAALV